MKTMNPNVRRWIAVAALVVIALLSVFVLAGRLSDPTFHAASITALDEKKVTVTELTAAVAAGSVIISAVPGDATTPIANQVAEIEQADVGEETGDEDSGLFDWVSGIGESITSGVTDLKQKAEQMLSEFIDAIAVLIVTNCVLPIAVLLFFLWVTKLIFGVQLPVSARDTVGRIHGRFRRKRAALRASAVQVKKD